MSLIHNINLNFFQKIYIAMHFDWSSYVTNEGAVTVLEEALPQYMRSLTTPLVPGSLVELQACQGEDYQLAVVKLVCDPLLQVGYIDPKCQGFVSQDKVWINTDVTGVFKYGHCAQNPGCKLGLSSSGQECGDWYGWCEDNKILELFIPLQQSFPPRSGLSPVTSITRGHSYELQDQNCPHHFWRVTVTDNLSGIVGLSLASPDPNCLTTDLYLHMFDERLNACGTVEATEQALFCVPTSLMAREYQEDKLTDIQKSFSQSVEERTVWDTAGQPLQKHRFEERMLLAVIDPRLEDRFRVAIVDRILDQFYFEISLLEQPTVKIVCSSRSQNLVPISWAIEKKFMAKASLEKMSCSPRSKLAPKHLFNIMSKTVPRTEVGQKMEYCSSFSEKIFYMCEILDIRGHILSLEVWTEIGKVSKLTTIQNLHLFPAGFAEANNCKFYIPEELNRYIREEEVKQDLIGGIGTEDGVTKAENCSVIDNNTSFLVRPTQYKDSSWCPPIYFNHLCYSASFLSKHRLESLPRFIGSGPVRLVMREVLSRLIGASFKSGAVLKKLEVGVESKRRQDYWLEPMKGKSRVLALQADIEIPSRASQVAGFCREVCQKLSCCPYLFGPQRVGEECPSACNSRPKSHFQSEGDQLLKVTRKGRRGRKRQKVAVSVTAEEAGGESSAGESGTSSPSCSTVTTTRDNSPDTGEANKRKNKNWGDILPPSEIKTRGAKLPSFSLQLKKRPSKKDVEELERLIASKCDSSDPDSPPRPPSPRLLRSKTANSLTDLKNELDYPNTAAFSFDDIPDCEQAVEPPPVWRVCLPSSPLSWTPLDVAGYLQGKEDVNHLAELFVKEEVDGEAFLLLNLPTVLDHWNLRMTEAITLCRHIESVKFAFYEQFAFEEDTSVDFGHGVGRGG